jgi:hypothetical protein
MVTYARCHGGSQGGSPPTKDAGVDGISKRIKWRQTAIIRVSPLRYRRLHLPNIVVTEGPSTTDNVIERQTRTDWGLLTHAEWLVLSSWLCCHTNMGVGARHAECKQRRSSAKHGARCAVPGRRQKRLTDPVAGVNKLVLGPAARPVLTQWCHWEQPPQAALARQLG